MASITGAKQYTMTIIPTIKLNHKDLKALVNDLLKVAGQENVIADIESIIPLALGNNEWSLTITLQPTATLPPAETNRTKN